MSLTSQPIISCSNPAQQNGCQRMLPSCCSWFVVFGCAFLFALSPKSHAQWQTQDVHLLPGWNAVFLHVDASHVLLQDIALNPIEEVWLWQPLHSADRFLSDPQQPMVGQDWASWHRSDLDPNDIANDTLARLIGNAAYLVKNGGATDITWSIQGRPVAPSYQWTSRGVNFIGFSTPVSNPPLFSDFLRPVQRLASGGEFFRYDDGDNDLTPTQFNALFNTVNVERGRAYWIRHADEFNRYFGAFELVLQSASGVSFGTSGSQYSVRVRNTTDQPLSVTLTLLGSEVAPAGQPTIVAIPPLLLRGALNANDLTYGYTAFANGPQVISLNPQGEPGAEVELILGIDRVNMIGQAGDLFAGILQLTDSLGYTQIDLPVSATQGSSSGLWVGEASVNQVRHYLKNYQRDTDGLPVQDSEGRYILTSTDTSIGAVARPFDLRLIVHKSDAEARLLQRVFHGLNSASNPIVTTQQSLLDSAQLANARRISAAHLPFSDANTGWVFSGGFAQGQTVSAEISVSFGDYASNPFLHGFHPDHDNLNASFDGAEVRGAESYDVKRNVTLTFEAPGNDFASRVSGGNQMIGRYDEAITFMGRGAESLQIDTAGAFVLRRVSEIESLTTP